MRKCSSRTNFISFLLNLGIDFLLKIHISCYRRQLEPVLRGPAPKRQASNSGTSTNTTRHPQQANGEARIEADDFGSLLLFFGQ